MIEMLHKDSIRYLISELSLLLGAVDEKNEKIYSDHLASYKQLLTVYKGHFQATSSFFENHGDEWIKVSLGGKIYDALEARASDLRKQLNALLKFGQDAAQKLHWELNRNTPQWDKLFSEANTLIHLAMEMNRIHQDLIACVSLGSDIKKHSKLIEHANNILSWMD